METEGIMEAQRMFHILRSFGSTISAVLRWPADGDDVFPVLEPTWGNAVTVDVRARGLSGALDVGRARGADVPMWR
jgi:hypothetical protein